MLSNNADADAALHLFLEANRLLREAGEKLAAASGQTHARRMVLQAASEASTIADIARSLGLQRQGVQRVADELVSEGFGRYEENPRHRRSKLFVATDAGASSLSVIQDAHAEWVNQLKAGTPEVDWSSLSRNLEHVIAYFKAQSANS